MRKRDGWKKNGCKNRKQRKIKDRDEYERLTINGRPIEEAKREFLYASPLTNTNPLSNMGLHWPLNALMGDKSCRVLLALLDSFTCIIE